MRQKLMVAFLTVSAFSFTSCYDDEVKALKKEIKRLEKITGTNEPIVATFSTKNNVGKDVITNTAYYFNSVSWATSYMSSDGGNYLIHVERAADVEWRSSARFEFVFDPANGKITGATCDLNFLSNDGNIINASFIPGRFTENTVDVNIQYFNIETGQIRLTIFATTVAASENNSYPGQPMTLELSFSGKLGAIEGGGE